jgi:hypothetical protein
MKKRIEDEGLLGFVVLFRWSMSVCRVSVFAGFRPPRCEPERTQRPSGMHTMEKNRDVHVQARLESDWNLLSPQSREAYNIIYKGYLARLD